MLVGLKLSIYCAKTIVDQFFLSSRKFNAVVLISGDLSGYLFFIGKGERDSRLKTRGK